MKKKIRKKEKKIEIIIPQNHSLKNTFENNSNFEKPTNYPENIQGLFERLGIE